MKRTITMKNEGVYYKNRHISYLYPYIRSYFHLRDGRYVITITEGTQFRFVKRNCFFYLFYDKNKPAGCFCSRLFSKLFFEPDGRKRYDIDVRKIS